MFRFLQRRRPAGEEGFRFSPEVTARVHGDGAVFLHSAKGMVFSCNAVGAKVWTGLREGRGVEEIAVTLAQEYGVSPTVVARDAGQFVAELESAGILTRSGHEARV